MPTNDRVHDEPCTSTHLKARIERADYVVDADAVAEALLRRPSRPRMLPGVSRPRARSPRADGSAPPELNADPGRSGRPRPTHVTPLGRRVRRHAGAQLEVLAAGRRQLGGGDAELRRDLRDAGRERQRVEVDLDPHAAAPRRRGAASVAMPSERSIIACAPAARQRAALRPAAARGRR